MEANCDSSNGDSGERRQSGDDEGRGSEASADLEGGAKLQGLLKSDCAGVGGNPKKSVSFLSSSFDRSLKVVDAPDCLNYMRDGSELLKIRPGGRHFKRFFYLDLEAKEIRWNPSSKKRQKARLGIDQLKEVRRGRTSSVLKDSEVAAAYPGESAFTIVYGEEFHSMDLVALSPDEANVWITGLTCLIGGRPGQPGGDTIEKRQLMRDRWLEEVFSSASLDDEGFLDEQDVIQLMKKLNTGVNTTRIRKKLKEVDLQTPGGARGRLSSSEFASLFKEISTRPEVYFLLVRYSSDGDYLSVEDLLLFLEAEQGNSKVTKEKCIDIIQQFEPSSEGRVKGHLGIDGFTALLLSEHCAIFDCEHSSECQDMTQPLPHYFVNSSHNTYLLEDQLKGRSSCEGYERALKLGARYIELEVWNGQGDEPIIYHGHTLTSKIDLLDVLRTIDKFAFSRTDMPLIVSVENHCSLAQQAKVAQYLRSVLGERLLLPDDPLIGGDLLALSPADLRRRILLKGKKLLPADIASPPDADAAFGHVSEEDESIEIQRDRSPKSAKKGNQNISGRKIKLSKELSDLVVLQSNRFIDFDSCSASDSQPHVWSLSESAGLRLAQLSMDELVNHCRRFLTKVQPNAIRVDSSNYNPQDMWNCGCQVVSLNHQTPGLMMDLNRGHFSKNGACGYVLKPGAMREGFSFFTFHARDSGLPGVAPHTLHIRIISGSQLPKPKASVAKGDVTDPYVVAEMFGLPADCCEERTKTVHGNGYNPLFDESFEFHVSMPELALLRLVVLDDDAIGDDFIGQFTIPFECIQTGYRHVQLLNAEGEPLPQTHLFVHVAITNRLGGGRLGKRTFSKKKKRSDYPQLKLTGFKEVDDIFKAALPTLREAAALREGFDQALSSLKDSCGLSHIANVKQCVRNVAARAAAAPGASDAQPLRMICRASFPCLEPLLQLPDPVRKSLAAFDQLVVESKKLIQGSTQLHARLMETEQSCLQLYDDLPELCNQAKTRKLAKVVESFAWNVRILRGQADLLLRASDGAATTMVQAEEAGDATGLAMTSV